MTWLKRILTILLVLFLVGLGAGVFLGYKYQDKAVPFVIEQMNKYLITPVSVNQVELSFIQRFPEANIKLSGVTALGSNPLVENDTLFALEEIYLTFDLIKLYKGDYILNRVELHNGTVALSRDKKGSINYQFIADTDTVQTSSNFKIDLTDVLLKNVDVQYIDEQSSQDIQVFAQKFQAKGSFGTDLQSVALYGSGTVRKLEVKEDNYINNEPVFLDAALDFNVEEEYYNLSRGILRLRDNYDLAIKGKFGKQQWNLDATAKNVDLEALPAMLPAYIAKPIADLQGSGKLDATIGLFKKLKDRQVNVQSSFHVEDGQLKIATLANPVNNLTAVVKYERLSNKHELRIDSLACRVGESTLKGKADIQNLDKPVFRIKGQSKVNLASLKNELQLDQVEVLEGEADVSFSLQGELPESDSTLSSDVLEWQKSLSAHVTDINVKKGEIHVLTNAAEVTLNGNTILVEDFEGSYNKALLTATLLGENALTNLVVGQAPKKLKGEIHLAKYEAIPDTSTGRISIPQEFNYAINATIDTLLYKDLVVNQAQGKVLLNKSLYVNNFTARALGGRLEGDVSMHSYKNGILTKLNVNGYQIGIQETFKTFNDFEQSAISYTHLKGKADVNANFMFTRNHEGVTIPASIEGAANLRITQGELVEYKPLYSIVTDFRKNKVLSFFIKLDDFEERLKHVKFDTLENRIEVRNETVYIPAMDISSSAMDLSLSGNQTFDNKLNYNIGFNLKQVLLANKEKPLETEYGYIEDDGTGNKMVYLTITGTAENPKIKFDKSAAKARRKQIVTQELNTTKAILNEEFGLFKQDSLPALQSQEKAPEQTIDLEEFDAQLETSPIDPANQQMQKPDSTKTESKWKKLLKKVSGEESKSKFENWEFEENDDW